MFAVILTFLTTCRSRCRRRMPKETGQETRISVTDGVNRSRISGSPGTTATVVTNVIGSQTRTLQVGTSQAYCTCHLHIHSTSSYFCARHGTVSNLDPVELMSRRTPPPPYVYFVAQYDMTLALQQQQQRANQNSSERFPPHPNSVSHQPHPTSILTVSNLMNPTGISGPNPASGQSLSPPPSYDDVVNGGRVDRSLTSPPPSYDLCIGQPAASSGAASSNG